MELFFEVRGAPYFKAARAFAFGISNDEKLGAGRGRNHGRGSGHLDGERSPLKLHGTVALLENGGRQNELAFLVGDKVGLADRKHCLRLRLSLRLRACNCKPQENQR